MDRDANQALECFCIRPFYSSNEHSCISSFMYLSERSGKNNRNVTKPDLVAYLPSSQQLYILISSPLAIQFISYND
jgi:hypothetical protein